MTTGLPLGACAPELYALVPPLRSARATGVERARTPEGGLGQDK